MEELWPQIEEGMIYLRDR
jgi:death on curing protein